MKQCKKCNENKELNHYTKDKNVKDGFNRYCKSCIKELDSLRSDNKKLKYILNKDIILLKRKEQYLDNIESVKKRQREYSAQNKEKRLEYNKNNKGKIREYNNKTKKHRLNYYNNRYKNDNLYKLKSIIRSRINESLKKKGYDKNNKTIVILGCTYQEFKLYLESKFESWMTWENQGLYNGELNYGWDIDHIIPISSAKNEEEILKLNYFSNLQPLCSKVNRDIKRDRLDYTNKL